MGISRNKIFLAISERKKIRISYIDWEGVETVRIIHPHHVFRWHRNIYFIGFCEYDGDIRNFKLSRIKRFEMLNEKFKGRIPSFSNYRSQDQFKFFGYRYPIKQLHFEKDTDSIHQTKDRSPLPPPKHIYQSTPILKKTRNDYYPFDNGYPIRYTATKLVNGPALCRSPLEEGVFDYLNHDPTVRRYWIEPISIPFDQAGAQHTYTPDILIEYNNHNQRLLIEAKSMSEITSHDDILKFKIAFNYCSEQQNLMFQVWSIENGKIQKFGIGDILELKSKGKNELKKYSNGEGAIFKRFLSYLKRFIK